MKCGFVVITLTILTVRCVAIDQNATKVPLIFDVEITKEVNYGANFAETFYGIFMMAANNIYLVNITKTEKRFDQIAKIHDVGDDVTGFEAVTWEDRVIFIVTHIDHFNVYRTEVVRSDAVLSPVQKVAIFGKYVRVLCFTVEGNLFLVIGTNFTEAHGRLSLYKWELSSFHLQEEKNLPSLSDLMVLSENSSPVIFTVRYGKRRSSKTSVQTFVISENKLKRTHNLYVDSNLVLPVTQNGSYFILACSNRLSVCLTYTVADEDLDEFGKETLNMTIKKLAYGKNFILAEVPGGEFIIFRDLEMKEFTKFQLNQTDFETSTNLITTKNGDGKNYAVIAYVRPDKVLLKIVDINLGSSKAEQNEQELKSPHNALYTSLSKLQKILLNRKNEIQDLKNILSWKNYLKTREIVIKKPFYVKSGNVGKVTVKNRNFLSLPELKTRLDQLRERLINLNNLNVRKAKKKRSVGDNFKFKTVRVKNLWYNGTVLEGIEEDEDENKIILKAERIVTNAINFEEFKRPLLKSVPRSEKVLENVIHENITVKEIFVKNINGIDWNRFYEEVFLKNRDTTIEGDLILKSPTNIKSLVTDKMDDRLVANFFTLNTDQEIHSNLLAAKVKGTSIVADDLNGIRFETDAVTVGKNLRFIESTIIARSIKIDNNLTLSKDDPKNFVRHMTRNLGSGFLQLYKNKVKINGILTVTDLDLDPNLQGFINGKGFNQNFKEFYWLKSINQLFEDVTFKGSVEVQQIKTDRLNAVNISNYLLTNQEAEGNIFLVINSSTVRGSVFNDNEISPSKAKELNTKIIRKGEKAVCRNGIKEFAEVLEIDRLQTEEINKIAVDDLVTRDLKEISFSGTKNFSLSVVDREFLTDDLIVDDLNGINLQEFFKNSIDLSRNMTLKKLILSGRSSFTNIFFDTLNDYEISQIMDILEVAEDDKITLHKIITVEGDGIFEGGIETVWINDLNWNNYFKLIVFMNESTEIGGIKTFTDALTVQDTARIDKINGINTKDFFSRLLLKTRPQTIKNKWNFGSIIINGDLTAPLIDGTNTKLLINNRDISIKIEGDLIVEDIKIFGSLYGRIDDNFDLYQMRNDLAGFDQDSWKCIRVIKTAEIRDENSFYRYLSKNAVLRSMNQDITGKVIFKNEIFLESVNSVHLIDGINLLFKDCLLKRSSREQIVMSKKEILTDLILKSAAAHSHVAVDIVNNVDIFGFNSSIYRLTGNDLIAGRKIFKNSPPVIGYLHIYGLINNADLNKIVQVKNFNNFLPPIRITDFTIETPVTIKAVNMINFGNFLRDRARLEGAEQEFVGNLIFERLTLAHNITAASVNNIDITELIEKSSESLQEVYGEKTITGNLYLLGPSHLGYLNGIDFMARYERSVDLKKNYNINEAALNHATFDRGVNIINSANGRRIDEYLFWYKIYNETILNNFQQINNNLNRIYDALSHQFSHNRLLYLEHDTSMNGIWGKYLKNPIAEEIVRPNCLLSDPNCLCRSSKLLIQISPSGRIFVSTPKNPTLKKDQYDFRVMVNNICDRNSSGSELYLSWNSGFYDKSITFNYFIGDLQNFVLKTNSAKFLMIQFILGIKNTALYLVKVDTVKNQIDPIQNFKEFIGFDMNFKVYNLNEMILMIISTQKSISIYEFHTDNNLFIKIQDITGTYNIFDIIELEKISYHLILTCRKCNTIAIYVMNIRNNRKFEIFQNIRINFNVNSLTHLIGIHVKYLIVKMSPIDGFYQIFKYSSIQGWTLVTFGNFPNIQAIYSLERVPNSDHENQLLVMSLNKSTIVTLYTQG